MGEIEREGQGNDGSGGVERAAPEQREESQGQVAGDADGGHGDVGDLGVLAVVDDAAVPLFVDGAGLGSRFVVNVQGEDGNQDTGEGEEGEEVSHCLREMLPERGCAVP